MKMITFIENHSQLQKVIEFKELFSIEIILGMIELSRYTKNNQTEMLDLLMFAKKNNLDVVLEWDALYQEEKFKTACLLLDHLPLHEFKAIRVQDPGAVEYIKTKYPWLKIQLILENGNHNLIGLQKWCEYLGPQCERLVLSNELSKEKLSEYASVLNTSLEVLAFGRILLFYSPRLLLSPLEKTELLNKHSIEAFGTSEESPHSGFPLIENSHGTFMFNVKDLYLLEHLEELREMKIENLRVDLRFDDSFKLYGDSLFDLFSGKVLESSLSIKKSHLRPVIKGFYNINKTDVLFSKLKNKRTQRLDEFYIGEIVDVERDHQLALLVKTNVFETNSLKEIKFVTPEGKDKVVSLTWMKSSLGVNVEVALKNDLVLIPYTGGVTVKTQVYLNPKT